MRGVAVTLSVAFALAASACGTGTTDVARAPDLPKQAVPTRMSILGTDIVVQPNTDKRTQRAFLSVGSASLVDQAGVWELRKAEKLVGTLQLVTLDATRADTRKHEDRTAIRAQILSGNESQLDFDGLPVWAGKDGDRALYVWYGRQVLSVLQVKSDELDAEETVTQFVNAMVDSDVWPAMSPDAYEEDL